MQAVAEVNERTAQAEEGQLGRRQRITEVHLRQAESAVRTLVEVQGAIQNALFDCERDLRDLRERELSPAELLVDGERLILQYRFLRRRARVLDGLLAYLPLVSASASHCAEHLRLLKGGGEMSGRFRVPDCGFAQAALEDLQES